MSMPPVDKIDEVPDNLWDVLFQGFLSPELLRRLDTPVMDEGAIEEFENGATMRTKLFLVLLLVRKQLWFLNSDSFSDGD